MPSRFHRESVGILALLQLLFLCALCPPGMAAEREVRLASLFWPPYTGTDLPGQGSTTQAVQELLSSNGYSLSVDFMPWARAIKVVDGPGSGYDGYFPEYYTRALGQRCTLAGPVGESPLGFVVHRKRADAIGWDRLEDLGQYRIGLVQDYINTDEFDALVADGTLAVELTTADQQNILKVASGRLDMAVIDRNVLSWLIEHDSQVRTVGHLVTFHEKLLAKQELFVCFRNDGHLAPLMEAVSPGTAQGGP